MSTFPPPPNYRFERKFTLDEVDRSWILQQVKLHPSFFQPIFHPRQINNIYLDTPDYKFYEDNIHGIANRKKVRIRWYGDTFGKVLKPKLEYKLKNNLLGDKWTFDLAPFEIKPGFSLDQLPSIFSQSNLPPDITEDLRTLSPSLLNSYQRTYFLSANKKYRLTFDEELSYYGFDKPNSHFSFKRTQPHHFIVELKYSPEDDKGANQIAKKFRYRLDKSSKYVDGVELTRF